MTNLNITVKIKSRSFYIFSLLSIVLMNCNLSAQTVLMGENPPHGNLNDGNFSTVWDYWRNASQSPFWSTTVIEGENPMGLHYGALFSSNKIGIATSKTLNTNPKLQTLQTGDTLVWSFGADLEYVSKGTISLSLVFGKTEHLLAEKVKLIGSDQTIEHFKGKYIVNKVDAQSGLPYVKATFYSENDVKVYLHYLNIVVKKTDKNAPYKLHGLTTQKGIKLQWQYHSIESFNKFKIYRLQDEKKGYISIDETSELEFTDNNIINGVSYNYLVTALGREESNPSNIISISKLDKVPPNPPKEPFAEPFDSEIKISWLKSPELDIAYYSVSRGDSLGRNMSTIGSNIQSTSFEDLYAKKETTHSYQVYAHDYSGNKSEASKSIKAKVKTVHGASFKDLILPMPIHKRLQSDLWGAESVIPRDPDNGIEHPDWSYWGGHPIYDADEKYHMLVVRWPEKALKGHWEWPNSTVVHAVSNSPTGPYLASNDNAYEYAEGLGHNADILKLNDGRYLLYALINWEPTLFTSETMRGPWKREGVMKINYDPKTFNDDRVYQVERNLSGLQLEDGSFLFITKFGRMMKSQKGFLGPYEVLTDVIQKNTSIPERYRQSNYEDPVMWKDEVQFHCIINAFLDKRAIYLRSKDGIHWKFDPGIAYDTKVTSYTDGTETHWYKLERPHILQDEFGRATHLSLAALDVPKKDDYANDNHNSKNIIIPLLVHKRLKILNKERVNSNTAEIKILIKSEGSFNPNTDIDTKSLRFGASELVNFGKGSKLLKSQKKGKDLILIFDGKQTGLTDENFTGKLLGQTKNGELIIGFSKLKAD